MRLLKNGKPPYEHWEFVVAIDGLSGIGEVKSTAYGSNTDGSRVYITVPGQQRLGRKFRVTVTAMESQ